MKENITNKYDKAMMNTAIIWSKESSCKRSQVGAIISKAGRIIATGYNGTITGADNKCESDCKDCDESSRKDCKICGGTGLVSNNTVCHAEMNALMFAGKHGIATEDCTLYVTLTPCIECAKMIIQSGIIEVVYLTPYRISSGIDFLKEHNINIRQYKD